MQEENSMLPTNYNAEYEQQPLKLIVVMGFQDSGKTTCLDGRTTPLPLFAGLCRRLTGGLGVAIGGNEHCREAVCTINGKTVHMYFGSEGDSESIVYENIKNIGDGSSKPYDVVIITLQRKSVNQYMSVGTLWQKWIDKSIQDYLTNTSRMFPSHERYYVHTVIPQVCTSANSHVGQIGTQIVKPPQRKCDLLTTCLQDHILDLLSKIV